MRSLLRLRFLFALLLLPGFAGPALAQIPDEAVDAYLKTTLEHALAHQEEQLETWKSQYSDLAGTNIVTELIGYQPPTFLVYTARLAAHLYERTGDVQYAETTRNLLVTMESYRQFFPEQFSHRPEYANGVPVVNWFRALPLYVEAYLDTRDAGVYSDADLDVLRMSVASSVDVIFNFPEWSAMNRTMLRAESLMAAAVAFSDHERAPQWRKLAEILAGDSLEQWEIEDASIYHPIWLWAYVNYLDLSDQAHLFQSPLLKYYFDYFVSLLTPDRTIPEFGDGQWNMNLNETYVLLERGATAYQSGEMKWAASEMFERMGGVTADGTPGPAFDEPNNGFAVTLIRRRANADPGLAPVEPHYGSGDALDEIISKKIVFRSDWSEDAAYLLLNYKDEGYYSILQKDYLKRILAVEEEKAHHGQSDENSICLFMKDGAVLLSDGGYRPQAPSGDFGAYRSDFFHNRIVVRNAQKALNQGYFDVIRDAGAYNESVRTTKLDFQSFPDVEYSRTRLDDPRRHYQWDRTLLRDTAEDFFIVVDALKFTASDQFTIGNLWHTRQIVDQGEGWFVTRIDSLMGRYANPGTLDLLVLFLQDKHTGIEDEERNFQREQVLFQGVSQPYAAGQMESFVTVLFPLERGADPAAVARRFTLAKDDDEGVAVRVDRSGESVLLGVKLDLDHGLLAENVRPRYTFESDRITYGDVTTDADMFFLKPGTETPIFAATNLMRFIHGETVLFDAPESQFFQVWGRSDRSGQPKWRRWDNYDGSVITNRR